MQWMCIVEFLHGKRLCNSIFPLVLFELLLVRLQEFFFWSRDFSVSVVNNKLICGGHVEFIDRLIERFDLRIALFFQMDGLPAWWVFAKNNGIIQEYFHPYGQEWCLVMWMWILTVILILFSPLWVKAMSINIHIKHE